MIDFFRLIAAGAELSVLEGILAERPDLGVHPIDVGATRSTADEFFLGGVDRHVYAGDTALHLAAAAHRPDVVAVLLDRGAAVDATNRRRGRPLHHATGGSPGSDHWRPDRQIAVITLLVDAGADPDAADANGATPLHRAVRTRCSAAVETLLRFGADPGRRNAHGSTPIDLATRSTGRSGSGQPAAKVEQQRILEIFGRPPMPPVRSVLV